MQILISIYFRTNFKYNISTKVIIIIFVSYIEQFKRIIVLFKTDFYVPRKASEMFQIKPYA